MVNQPILNGHVARQTIGTDTSKSSNPSIGDTHIATDTGKAYTCFVSGFWSVASSSSGEHYSNHLGTVDNIMSNVKVGNGNGTSTAATHRYDLTSGIGAGSEGYSSYNMNLEIIPNESFIFNVKLQNIIAGVGGQKQTIIGVIKNISELSGTYFYRVNNNAWSCNVMGGSGGGTKNIPDLVDGDIVSIIGNNYKTIFLVNGNVVYSDMGYVPGFATERPMIYVRDVDGTATTAVELSVDYIEFNIMK